MVLAKVVEHIVDVLSEVDVAGVVVGLGHAQAKGSTERLVFKYETIGILKFQSFRQFYINI
jgi:hypothetical protein